MNRPMKVLILYASYGDGHLQVSQVLQKKLSEQGIEATLVDLFAESHPHIDRLMRQVYLKSYALAPALYGLSYYMTREMDHHSPFSQWFNSFGMSKMRKIIEREQPTLIINTFPMLVVPELKRRKKTTIPVFTVLTDFVLHNRWIHPNIDRYYVATNDLKEDIANKGIPEEKIAVSGIPLRHGFYEERLNNALRKKYPFQENRKVILIMAGAYGVLNNLKDMCLQFADSPYDVAVVCGKNVRLERKLKNEFKNYGNIHVMGFIENIHELMLVSSCIITKPGGITLSEAIQTKLPIFLFRPSSGQEKENAIYLEKKGVAKVSSEVKEMTNAIFTLLEDDLTLEQMRVQAKVLRIPHSTDKVVLDIVKELELT